MIVAPRADHAAARRAAAAQPINKTPFVRSSTAKTVRLQVVMRTEEPVGQTVAINKIEPRRTPSYSKDVPANAGWTRCERVQAPMRSVDRSSKGPRKGQTFDLPRTRVA